MKVKYFPMHMEIYYSHVMDWCIRIWKGTEDNEIVTEQDMDMELCFAKAHAALKEWLSENEGGY
ncbi:MAG: hypothetical protein LUD72_06620 [Bacteroidales bacterium]|nr:hypothetical protein [Bacteroidales bacterium]